MWDWRIAAGAPLEADSRQGREAGIARSTWNGSLLACRYGASLRSC
jgi:hypothetical protein